MTIFLKVLIELIKDQLNPRSVKLADQSKSYGYNHKLSIAQKEIIDALSTTLSRYNGTVDDQKNTKEVEEHIQNALKKVQHAREAHKEKKDRGETIECLNKIRNNTSSLYDKLVAFATKDKKAENDPTFNLLNRTYYETPENVVYFHAIFYFGQEIFEAALGLNQDIRTLKEKSLARRLVILSELIKPEFNLNDRKTRALQVLLDLNTDNQQAIKTNAPSIPIPVPGLKFFGTELTAPNELLYAGDGRIKKLIDVMEEKINAMTNEDFEKPPLPRAVTPAAAPNAPPPPPPAKKEEEEEEETTAPVP